MPNHVRNKITFDCSPERRAEILAAIEYDEAEQRENERGIDFNKIIPMPQSLDITSGSTTDHAIELYLTSVNPAVKYYGEEKMEQESFNSLIERLQSFRYIAPYNIALTDAEIARRCEHDTDESILQLGKTAVDNLQNHGAITWYEWRIRNWGTKWNSYSSYLTDECCEFETAWAAPHPILQKLSEMFPDVRIEHEWADEDLGSNCGRSEYFGGECELRYYPESDKEGMEHACSVWGYDLAEMGYYLNSDGTDYICPNQMDYDVVTFDDKIGLFCNERLTSDAIPEGLYRYGIRTDDKGVDFSTIEERVTVNHGGTLLTKEPLDFHGKEYITLNEENGINFVGQQTTIGDFMDINFKIEEGPALV